MKNLDQYISESLKGYKLGAIKPKEQLPENCKEYFSNKKVNVDEIENLDTSNVTNTYKMFLHANFNSNSLDLSSWDVSNVVNMNQMFNCCNNLKSLDLSNWNIHNASDMYSMFYDCYQLEYIDVSNWDMSNVEDVYGMFANCKSLKSLDLSSWDFKIKDDKYKINSMFKGCESLNSLDVSTFDLSNFVNAPNIYEEDYEDTLDLFDGCYNLTNIIFGPGWGKSNDDYINLILFECGKNKGYKLSDKTYESMLTMYDRKKAGLSPMEITFNKKHNIPDDWKEKMEERGYEITIFKHY